MPWLAGLKLRKQISTRRSRRSSSCRDQKVKRKCIFNFCGLITSHTYTHSRHRYAKWQSGALGCTIKRGLCNGVRIKSFTFSVRQKGTKNASQLIIRGLELFFLLGTENVFTVLYKNVKDKKNMFLDLILIMRIRKKIWNRHSRLAQHKHRKKCDYTILLWLLYTIETCRTCWKNKKKTSKMIKASC